ncbi:TraM recognition domain-containing protein [Candidatus Comchoanobacter bicostacola]|uniref:TraM recognition domain-containing protein n=1 Tax=Candidatus Comchoanobacter bicostacola TaxID=2919598 RepID=UPI003CCCC612
MTMADRGIYKNQEQSASALIRDTRSITQKFSALFDKPVSAAILITVTALFSVFIPVIADFVFLLNIIFVMIILTRRVTLPFRMPQFSGAKDYNDLNPGTGKANKASGIYYFGNEKKDGQELWFADTDMRTHVLIFGSTGSGKTVFLIGLAFNALVQSSGFIYVDGKGDNSLYANIFSIVRFLGREDDLLLINFMTGAKDIIGPQEKRLSNTLNPFATGSSSMLANLVTGMMDSGSGGNDGDMWKGRAIAFVEALLKILVAMRDSGNILLDANTIRNYFSLERLEAMADNAFIRDDGAYTIDISSYPGAIKEPVLNYLSTLPGYNKEKRGQQVSQVYEQHGYITMQLTRIFTSLADTYGHILRTRLAEVDLKDVVLNRRILVVLLPALEKSPDELSNLGKVVIASMRSMMAAGLGDSVEGDYRDLIISKPTNAETPFLCILDEYGYYAVKGFAVVPAQARSLGFSVVFAGQDLPAFQKASKEEAASIGANTNIKICMKLEDPLETFDFFNKGAGEAYVTAVDSFNAGQNSLSNSYLDTKSAKTEKRARIDLLDLKDQGLGEAHIFFKSDIVRAKTFYANPKPCKYMQLNQFLKVEQLSDVDLFTFVKGIEDFEVLQVGAISNVEQDALIDEVAEVMGQTDSLIDNALILLTRSSQAASSEGRDEAEGTDLNIFSRYMHDQKVYDPIINKKLVQSTFVYAKRFLGMPEADANKYVEGLLNHILKLTDYKLADYNEAQVEKFLGSAEKFINSLNSEEEK